MPIPFHSGTKTKSRQIILGIIESECCTLECLRCLSFKDIEGNKNEFTSIRSMVNERNYILSYLTNNTSTPNGINNYKTVFKIKRTPVCKQAWIQVHGINERRFDRIYSDFKTGSKVYVHGNTGLKRRSNKTSQCIAWLTFLINNQIVAKFTYHLVSLNWLYTRKLYVSWVLTTQSANHNSTTSWRKSLRMCQYQR